MPRENRVDAVDVQVYPKIVDVMNNLLNCDIVVVLELLRGYRTM